MVCVLLVGCVTSCVKEKTEHISKKSLAKLENGLKEGGSEVHIMFGTLNHREGIVVV